MKIVIVSGSYRRNGVIAAVVESLVNGIKSVAPSAEITTVNLLDTPVEFCSGCYECAKSTAAPAGECRRKDAMESILKAIVDCDRLVFATPVYMYSPTALMKRFMERCLPLSSPDAFLKGRTPLRNNKKGLVIISTGAPSPFNVLMGFTRNAEKVLSILARMSGCSHVEKFRCGGAQENRKIMDRCVKNAFARGARFARP